MGQHYCEKCKKMLDDKNFYMSRNKEKYPPDGRVHMCKNCMTMHVNNWDPETYKWILKEIDVPYIKEEWDSLLAKWGQDEGINGLSIIGRYISKMKLKQWNKYRWEDTEAIAQENLEKKVLQMKAQGLTEEEIMEQLSVDTTPPEPTSLASPINNTDNQDQYIEEDYSELTEDLTDEDKVYLRLKWGRSYRPDEWVRMEQLYNDMMKSYDIQSAGHKDTLIMVCKTSLKANQLIDAGDIEGFQKMQKAYDSLMRSGKFTAAQIKEQDGESIDSIGELVALCEKEGFIPRYYIDSPKDQVDRTLQDMQQYTKTLVTEELNLGNMLEAAVREIESDREREAHTETDDVNMDEDERLAAQLFDEEDARVTTDKDYEDFENFKEALRMQDAEEVK